MDMFRRIGTQKKKFKLQFFIGRLKFSSFCEGKIYIVVRRGRYFVIEGNHKVKSQQKLQMAQDAKLNFNKQILELEVTLYFDEKQNKYQQKLGEIDIVLLDPKESKVLLGIVPFDVGAYANSGQQSMKQKKQIEQTPKKFQGLIEYNIFIKYIGEGSESSLDKISDFFFGKAKQPESQKKVNSKLEINSKKKIENEIQKEKDLSKTEYKKGSNNNFYDDQVQPNKKNHVTAGKIHFQKDKSNNIQSTQQIAKKFYFDEPQSNDNLEKHKKNKSKHRSNSMQKIKDQQKNKYKKGQAGEDSIERDSQKYQEKQVNLQQKYSKSKKQKIPQGKQIKTQSDKRITFQADQTYNTSNGNLSKQLLEMQRQLQTQTQQVESYRSRFEQSESFVKQLQKQLIQVKKQNKSLSQELQECKQEIKLKQQKLFQKERESFAKNQAHLEPSVQQKIDFYQREIKRIQKEKNEVIVQNSRLKQKYKQDFKKYEQTLSQRQQKQSESNESGKAQLQRIKQQCSKYRDTIQKLTKQKSDKNSELNKQKSENKSLQQQLTQVKTSLSKIKIKICNKLNEALVKNQQPICNMLMQLNRDQ